jgi:hypothetical protein
MFTHYRFYSLQLASVTLWWCLIRLATGKHLYSLCQGSVVTRPSWLAKRWLLLLASQRKFVVIAYPLSLVLGALGSEYTAVRALVALAVSLYHLLETSYTSRHGEYPVMYTSWVMVLPAHLAQAGAFGVAIHFVLSCGLAKCVVGGVRPWVSDAMAAYLDVYYESATSRPASRMLNRWLKRHAALAGLGTIALECVAVPATLALPATARPLVGVWGMIALHVGIALGMSVRVALVFTTTLPVYVVGFGCEAPVGSGAWWLAAVLALLPSGLALARRRMLSEDWPSTPCSLFMFNGEQAGRLARLTMTGRLGLVLATREVGELARAEQRDTPSKGTGGGLVHHPLVGLPVLHHGGSGAFGMGAACDGPVVHDAVLRAIGFTLMHADMIDAFDLPDDDPPPSAPPSRHHRPPTDASTPRPPSPSYHQMQAAEREMMRRLLRRLEAWLARERRLLETASGGRVLCRAFWVELADGAPDTVLNAVPGRVHERVGRVLLDLRERDDDLSHRT